MTTDLKAMTEKLKAELALATRHAKQLADLSPEARKRVREQIDRLLAENKEE